MTALNLMLSVILILAVLYIEVWFREPREGKMARKNRLLSRKVDNLEKQVWNRAERYT